MVARVINNQTSHKNLTFREKHQLSNVLSVSVILIIILKDDLNQFLSIQKGKLKFFQTTFWRPPIRIQQFLIIYIINK